jgi:hypothetical protein
MARDKSETRLTPAMNLIALSMIFAVDLRLAILSGLVFRDHKSMRSLSPDFDGSNRIGFAFMLRQDTCRRRIGWTAYGQAFS